MRNSGLEDEIESNVSLSKRQLSIWRGPCKSDPIYQLWALNEANRNSSKPTFICIVKLMSEKTMKYIAQMYPSASVLPWPP